MTRIREEEDH